MIRRIALTSRRLRREWMALVGLLLLFGAVMATALHREHRAVTAHEADRLRSQSRTVAENLERQLEGVSNALAGVRDAVGSNAVVLAPGATEADARLSLLAAAMPGVRTIGILDAGGTVTAASRAELLGRNFAHREYFDVPRRHPDRARTYVSTPIEASVDGFVVFVGKAVVRADGSFGGVVAATLNPDYFEVVLRSVVYAGDMRTSLVHGGGTVFIDVPPREPTAPSFATRDHRLTELHTVAAAHLHMDTPLAVTLSRDRSAVLEPWREKAARFSVFFAVVAAASCAGLSASQRRRRTLSRLTMASLHEREHGASLLRKSEERLSLALDGSGLALFDWDIGTNVIFHSAQAAALRGEEAREALLSPDEARRHVHPDDVEGLLARIRDVVVGASELYHCEFRLQVKSGEWLWVRARGRVVERDAAGRALRLAGTYANVNERKLAEERLRHLAEFDILTDLPNRALFHDRLRQAMLRTGRAGPMALLFLDVDRFKTVNDTLGHEAGDQLLKTFARRMRAAVRQSDTVARLAGDEFTIILEGLRDVADAKAVADKVVKALREPVILAGRHLEITTSIGIAMPRPGDTEDALLGRADAALYEAKRRGRNGWFCEAAS